MLANSQGTEGRQSQLLGFYFRAYRALLPPHAPDMLTVRIQVIDGTVSTLSLVGCSLPSPGVTRLQRYYEPLRIPKAPGLSLAGVRLIIPDHALGPPLLRTLSLCTCCRHYPGAAAGRTLALLHPAVSAFPERVVGSTCALSFSRLARRSLALRPAHSRCHQFVTRIPKASAISSPP